MKNEKAVNIAAFKQKWLHIVFSKAYWYKIPTHNAVFSGHPTGKLTISTTPT
jgi:hypothetical protein